MHARLYPLLASAIFISFLSCKKGDGDAPTATLSNSFIVNGRAYFIIDAYRSGITLYGKDSLNNYGAVSFGGGGPKEKTYDVAALGSGGLGDNEALVSTSRNGRLYSSTGQTSEKVTVTTVNGMLRVTCREIWLKENTGTDSLQFACAMIQTR